MCNCYHFINKANLQAISVNGLIPSCCANSGMMAHTIPDSIIYHGADYPESPDADAATFRIQQKVRNYYNHHRIAIEKYATTDLSIGFGPLCEIQSTSV